MIKIVLTLILLSIIIATNAQNLVPNGGFEQHTGCPYYEGQIDFALYWMNPAVQGPGGTPDYFNQCSPSPSWNVPNNAFGFENAHSGGAYCGLVAYGNGNWREYIEAALYSSLIANQCYHLELYLSLADRSYYTSDAIGAYFSNTAITGIMNTDTLPFIPQIDFNLGLNTDTVNWIQISENFTAMGGESYVIIGNYKSDSLTNSFLFNNSGNLAYSYFYIDDVSLTPCTSIEEQNQNAAIKIFPNPTNNFITIHYSLSSPNQTTLSLFNLYGQKLKTIFNEKQPAGEHEIRIDMKDLVQGVYFVKMNIGPEKNGTGGKEEVRKVVKY
ncbi:MAG: T9SS type A sorting domain-containing protein [Bacteroidota bacterium]